MNGDVFMYKIWAFFRQSMVRIHLFVARIIFKLSGGHIPKSLFSERSGVEKVGTTVRKVDEGDYWTTIAKFNADGSMSDENFVIVSSTDFHYDTNHEYNKKTTEMFVNHIKEVKPDLVVLTGDVILSKFQQIDAIQFAQMMEKIGIYWTAIFGNHEVREEKGFYKYLLMKSFADYEHCLCKHGPKDLFGYGNHTVNILGADGKLRQTLFLFDSGRDIIDEYRAEYGIPDDMTGYDFLKKEQIEFYKNEVDRLREKYGDFNSMMYMHIPLKEYENIFKDTPTPDGKYEPAGDYEVIYGEQYESVGSSQFNSGMFDAILEKGSTKAVFAGHDHINDWVAIYKGVHLCYSLPQGYNLYHLGTNFNKPESEWVQGVTVTTLHSDGSFDIKPRYNRIYL